MSRALDIAREQRDRALAAQAEAEMQLASVTRCRDSLIAATFHLTDTTDEKVRRSGDSI